MASKIWISIMCFLLMGGVLASCSGSDLGDYIRVRTPNSIQKQTGLSGRTTLNEAETEYRMWFSNVQEAGVQWQENIRKSNEVRGLMSQLTLNVLDQVGPMIGNIPVLGASLPVLSGIIGLFLGTSGKAKGKEKSYTAGLAKAAEIVK